MHDEEHLRLLRAALAYIPRDAEITVTVKVEDFELALRNVAAGPEFMTTHQAARYIGLAPGKWRDLAAAGRIEGAWQEEEGGRWYLPKASCAAYVADMRDRFKPRSRNSDDWHPFGSSSTVRRGPRVRRDAIITRIDGIDLREIAESVIRESAAKEGKTYEEKLAEISEVKQAQTLVGGRPMRSRGRRGPNRKS